MQNCTIDVIGIILEVGQTGSITLRSGEQRLKRTLIVGDDMKVSIGLTLWGDTCEAYQYEIGQIVAFKSCRVSEYQGRSLNASGDPRDITINPRHSRALELQKWQKGSTVSKLKSDMRSLGGEGPVSKRPSMLIEEVTKHCLESDEVMNGKPFYAEVHCEIQIIYVPDNADRQMFYLACQNCKRKVVDDSHGYRCENCNKTH